MKKVLEKHLTDEAISDKGTYAVAELVADYHQLDCTVVPKGTRGIITGHKPGTGSVFLFPHSSLPGEMQVFSDGHIRIVNMSDIKIVGRINHK